MVIIFFLLYVVVKCSFIFTEQQNLAICAANYVVMDDTNCIQAYMLKSG